MSEYDDIIDLEHSISDKRPRISRADRAAQFAPFAALTGFEAAIKETARQTKKKIDLSDDQRAELDRIMNEIRERLSENPEICVIYFKADEKKAGGEYIHYIGRLKKIDDIYGRLEFCGGNTIAAADIVNISAVDDSDK